MVPLTIAMSAFEVFSTEANENLDRTEKNIAHAKTGGGLGGAAAGAAAGAAIGSVVPIVGTVLGGLIGGGLGYFLGGAIGETVAEEISSKTDVSNVSGNVTLSQEDKEALADAAEDSGAVDIGWGHGDIDDLKKLSELETDTLESLLDTETWEDDDLEMIKNIIAAKKAGASIDFKEGGWFGDDTLEFGEAGSAGSPTVQSVNVSDSGIKTPLDDDDDKGSRRGGLAGRQAERNQIKKYEEEQEKKLQEQRAATGFDDKRSRRDDAIAAIEKEMDALQPQSREYEGLKEQLELVSGMTPDEFDKLTPDAGIMDRFYLAGTTKGSIYVHDIGVEGAISALGIILGNPEAVESDWLDKLKVTAGEWAEQASQNSGQTTSMVNAPTTIDQSSKQSVNMGSSAHAPAQPSGSGYMGVSTPRG